MDLLRFLFTLGLTYQISQIISESYFPLFRYIRNLKGNIVFNFISELTSCFLCTSVWVGMILSNYFFDISNFLGYTEISWVWSGLFYSCLSWFIHVWEAKQ